MRSWVITSCVALAFTGCAWFGVGPSVTVYATPTETLRAATSAFRHFDIPVVWQDARRGRLSSGPFTVEESWGGESLANRVDCGEEGGRPRVERGIVELRVDLEISTRRVRDGGFLSGGVVGTVPVESGRRREVARVSIDSSGRLYTPEGKTHSCRLTMEFAKRVIEYVAHLAGGTHSVP